MKIHWVRKIVCGLTIGSLFLSFGALAMANDDPMIHRPNIPPQENMPNHGDMERHISKSLDKLVADGTITKDQADKVIQFFKEKDLQRKADMEVIKDMSPEDREAYLRQKFNKRPDFIKELQNATDLSDEQAQAIAEAVRPPQKPNPNGSVCPMMPRP